ncbi:MAG: class I SAM-dependent methyltransferase [Microscillaceae bacterium]|nr:class I SAM-dependent methyltransferase [Microscillaceae bacterium]MDW8460538.1 class I SAM-dependent methyltransferase [Cytophagales bacterium]
MKDRETGITRLNPPLWNSRYYYLWQLRKEIERAIKKYLSCLGKKLRIADFGCGNSPYKPLFEPFCKEYLGIDLPENPKATIHILPEGKINLLDNQMDVVISTQVLEHVPNPHHYLLEAHRILTAEGLLILTTHGYWIYHPDPTDFWRWTSAGLKKIIQETGFELLELRGILGRSAMGMQLVQDGLIFKLPSFLRPFLSIPMQLLIFLLDKTHSQNARNQDACTFVVIAKKQK